MMAERCSQIVVVRLPPNGSTLGRLWPWRVKHRQCLREGTVLENGQWYCKQHTNKSLKRRNYKAAEKRIDAPYKAIAELSKYPEFRRDTTGIPSAKGVAVIKEVDE